MKKTLILTLIIIILCSGALIYVGVNTRGYNEVKFDQEVIRGDISAAEGIIINQRVTMGWGNFGFEWDNNFIFEDGEMTFYQYADDDATKEEETTVADDGNEENPDEGEQETDAEGNIIEKEVIEKPDDGIQLIRGYVGTYPSLRAIAETVAEERGIGTIVKFNEYVDHFSIKERIRVNGVTYTQVDIVDPFISLPIPEDLYFVVLNHQLDYPSDEVDEDGNPIPPVEYEDDGELHFYFVDKDGVRVRVYDLASHYIKGDDRLYMWINNRTPDGELQDTSEIECGYGIYQIKYDTLDALRAEDEEYEEESSIAAENPDAETTEAETDEAGEPVKRIRRVHDQSKYELFYEFDPSVIIKKIGFGYGEEVSDREKDFLVYTYEEDRAYLYIIDPKTAELRNKLFLGNVPSFKSVNEDEETEETDTEEEEYINKEHFYIWVKDNCIMVNVGDTTLSVIKKDEEGNYNIHKQIILRKITPIAPDHWTLGNRTAICYDDESERLAIVDYASYGGFTRYTGFKIAVFDKDGNLGYCGMYDSNLTYLNTTEELKDFSIPLTNNKKLTVEFKKQDK